MKTNKSLLIGYENSKLLRYTDLEKNNIATTLYEDLPQQTSLGPLLANFYKKEKLTQLYSTHENHVGVIAATRLGKTTGYVIPTIISFAHQKLKRNMIISDPKGEIYKSTANALKCAGYKVKLLNFRDYMHSECWNMLTPIYRKFKKIEVLEYEVETVCIKGNFYNSFRGKNYINQEELNKDIINLKTIMLEDVANDIDNLAGTIITTQTTKDPYWEDSARDLLKAFIWAMLEDSVDPACNNPITEDTFSFSTIMSIFSSFECPSGEFNDRGYFTKRKKTSRAFRLANGAILTTGSTTRACVLGVFHTKMSIFNDSVVRLITSCNSFEMTDLSDGPVAVFIDYRDEIKTHYQIISLFVQDAYKYLIEQANKNKGKLSVPFYFILDEFGNFPKLKDFDTVISACAGRNIFFVLIIQSYAQLDNVYGDKTAEIIRDNLNIHIFLGSNNPNTLSMFSKECGETSRFSPLGVLNGDSSQINNYSIETIPLVPKSDLAHFEMGECVITEANSPYVLYSKLEGFYKCKEFTCWEEATEQNYISPINPLEQKYIYKLK